MRISILRQMIQPGHSRTTDTVRARAQGKASIGVPGVSAGALIAAAAILLAGCSQLEPAKPVEPTTDPAKLYMRLSLNYPAVNLTTDAAVSAYNTLQLVATPYDANGDTITAALAPTFFSLDTNAVTVTADGLLRAHHPGNQVHVVATLLIGGVRRSDTATVNVTDIPAASVPILDTLSIHVPPDQAVWYHTGDYLIDLLAPYDGLIPMSGLALSPRTVTASGTAIQGLVIDYVSLDSTLATVDRHEGTPTVVAPGHVGIVARTMAYGVARADTMVYTVQVPFSAGIGINSDGAILPSQTIVAGGIVRWLSFYGSPFDMVFDDPTNVTSPDPTFCGFFGPDFLGVPAGPYCDAGNISAFIGNSQTMSPDFTMAWRLRQFLVPGTYRYHSTTNGAQGQIVVLAPIPLP